MKIGIAGHIATSSIARFLDGDIADLPSGYYGAPLLGTLIGALLERGHTVMAYTTSSDMAASARVSATGRNFKITYCPARPRAFRYSDGRWGRAADAFKLERDLLRGAMANDAPDLVHAHWSYEFALAAIESGLPHVVTCHDAPQVVLRFSPNLYRLVRYFMARRVLRKAQYITAVSPYLKQKLEGYARNPIRVVPNPLPSHPANTADRYRQLDPAAPRIVMILNGWGGRKNPEPALRAFGALRTRIPGAELVIMGDGYGIGGEAEVWAKSQGLADGVKFRGPLPYTTLLATLAESDVLLHPALEETFGMSIAEAMSLGVPIVGGRKSGAVPWVMGDGGVVTDVTSVAAIEAALHGLISDSAVHRRHAEAGKARAHACFSATQVAAIFETIYDEVLHNTRSRLPKSAESVNGGRGV